MPPSGRSACRWQTCRTTFTTTSGAAFERSPAATGTPTKQRTEAPARLAKLLLAPVRKGGFEHIADRLPATAVELDEAHLLDRSKIPATGTYLDIGQQEGRLVILKRRRLLHDTLAGQVVAALPEHLRQRFSGRVAVQRGAVVAVLDAIVFVLECQPVAGRNVVFPRGIADVLQIRGRYHADGFLQASGLEAAFYRCRQRIQDEHRVPVEIGCDLDRSSGIGRHAGKDENVGARSL